MEPAEFFGFKIDVENNSVDLEEEKIRVAVDAIEKVLFMIVEICELLLEKWGSLKIPELWQILERS